MPEPASDPLGVELKEEQQSQSNSPEGSEDEEANDASERSATERSSGSRDRYGIYIEAQIIRGTDREDPPPHTWNAGVLKDLFNGITEDAVGRSVTNVEILTPRSLVVFCGIRSRREGLLKDEANAVAECIESQRYLVGLKAELRSYGVTLHGASVRLRERNADDRAAKGRLLKLQQEKYATTADPSLRETLQSLVDAVTRLSERPSRSRRPSPGRNSAPLGDEQLAYQTQLQEMAEAGVNVDLRQANNVPLKDVMGTLPDDPTPSSPVPAAPLADIHRPYNGPDPPPRPFNGLPDFSRPPPPIPVNPDSRTMSPAGAVNPPPRVATSGTNTEGTFVDCRSQTTEQEPRGPRDKLRLPTFKNEQGPTATTYANWRWQVRKAFACGYPERTVFRAVIASLEGMPSEALRTSGTDATLADILARLDKLYDNMQTYAELHSKMMSIRQGDKEPVNDYAVKLDAAVDAIRTAYPDAMNEDRLLALHRDRFFDGLNLEYQNHLIHKRDSPISLMELVKEARILEEKGAVRRAMTYDRNRYNSHRGHGHPVRATVPSDEVGSEWADGYEAIPVYVRDKIERKERTTGECWRCDEPGHYYRNCPKRFEDPVNGNGTPGRKGAWVPPKTKPHNVNLDQKTNNHPTVQVQARSPMSEPAETSESSEAAQ